MASRNAAQDDPSWYVKLVWASKAQNDRRAIRNFIATDSPNAAFNFDELLSAQAKRLLSHPGLGRPGRVEGTRELVAHRHYILIYDVVDNAVRVLRVLHTSRQWPDHRTNRN